MVNDVINLDELHLSDKLAIERTLMGSDRTLLAQVRTSLALISFGFTIFKVLDHLQKTETLRLVRDQTPRNIGIFMLLVGIFPLALSMHQYRRNIKHLGGRGILVNPTMLEAGAILLLGFGLLLVIIMNLNVI